MLQPQNASFGVIRVCLLRVSVIFVFSICLVTLSPPCWDSHLPQTVALSPCGSFAVLGSDRGHVARFNMQSGAERGEFGSPGTTFTHCGGFPCSPLLRAFYKSDAAVPPPN